jgi:hypothetical protein
VFIAANRVGCALRQEGHVYRRNYEAGFALRQEGHVYRRNCEAGFALRQEGNVNQTISWWRETATASQGQHGPPGGGHHHHSSTL